MSITELSDAVNVGDSSVFRFCKTLQLKGYQEFRMRLSMGLSHEKASPVAITQDLSDFEALKSSLLNMDVAAIQETIQLIDEDRVKKAVDILLNADNFWFFGAGNSMVTAMEAFNKFLRITSKARFVEDVHMQSMCASLMTERDAAVIISYSGSTKDMVQIAETAKENGSKVITITRFLRSPLTAFSDITLLCSSMESPMQSGSISSKMSQLFLVDLLFNLYYSQTYTGSETNNEKVTGSVMEKLY